MLAALLAVATATAATGDTELEPGTHIAFVGERVTVKEDKGDGSCESEEAPPAGNPAASGSDAPGPLDVICIPHFNRVFEARYRVLERLAGDPHAPELTFSIADHYGVPLFSHARHALLVVTLDGDGNYLQKYMGFEVYRVEGGGWATCGSDASGARTPPTARPLRYLKPMANLHGEDPADIARWRVDPDLRVEGARLYCARGVPVDEYLAYLRDGVLAARKVVLEAAPAKP